MRDDSTARSAGRMGFGTLLSRITGLLREQVFAWMFGASHATDAFQIAFRIPNLLRDLFAEGALNSALVPTFLRTREHEGDYRAWQVVGRVFLILFVVVTGVAIVGTFYSESLVKVYAGAFRSIPGKFELTVTMTQIMFWFFPLVALAAGVMGILNANGVFFRPAFASALFNIASVVVGIATWGALRTRGIDPIIGMALGVVAGGVVQLGSQLPALRKSGYRFSPARPVDPKWQQDPQLRHMMRLMIPAFVGVGATQINILVNSQLATSLGEAAVSWLNYAFRLMQFPIGVFGVSLAAATLPVVSAMRERGDFSGVSERIERSLKQVFALNLPATAGLVFLGGPILQMIFEYGRFEAKDTFATHRVLIAYSLGLTFYSGVKVLAPICYAFDSAKIAVRASLVAIVANIAFNLLLVGPLGVFGLALGTSLASLLNFVWLLVWAQSELRRSGTPLKMKALVQSFLLYFLAALTMGVVCGLVYLGWVSWFGPWEWAITRVVSVSVLVTLGVLIMVGVSRLMGLDELNLAMESLAKRFKRG